MDLYGSFMFRFTSELPSNKYWNRKKNKSVHVQMDLYGSFMFRFMSELPSNKYWNRTKNKSVHVQMDVYGSFMFTFTSELPSNKFKRFLLFLACYTYFCNFELKCTIAFVFIFCEKKRIFLGRKFY